MIDLWAFVRELIAEFGRSDAAGGAPMAAQVWIANSFGHLSFGAWAAVARAPSRVLWSLWVALALKEVAFDLPGAMFAALAVADSMIDLALPLLGFILAMRKL